MLVRRREVVDEYVEDGRVAVYTTDGMVVLLSELASMAWSLLGEEWTAADQVSELLVNRFGSPAAGGAAALEMTEDALRTLAERHLVEVDET